MYSLTTILVFSFLSLIVGALAGAWLFHRFGSQGKAAQDLEQRLQKAEQQLEDYQNDVTEHFEETSRRVNTLTQNYKDVHEYLASSAMKLTNPQMSRAISQAAQQNLPHASNESEKADAESDSHQSTEDESLIEQEFNIPKREEAI